MCINNFLVSSGSRTGNEGNSSYILTQSFRYIIMQCESNRTQFVHTSQPIYPSKAKQNKRNSIVTNSFCLFSYLFTHVSRACGSQIGCVNVLSNKSCKQLFVCFFPFFFAFLFRDTLSGDLVVTISIFLYLLIIYTFHNFFFYKACQVFFSSVVLFHFCLFLLLPHHVCTPGVGRSLCFCCPSISLSIMHNIQARHIRARYYCATDDDVVCRGQLINQVKKTTTNKREEQEACGFAYTKLRRLQS